MLNKSTKWYVWIDLKKFMTLYHMIGFSNKFGIKDEPILPAKFLEK